MNDKPNKIERRRVLQALSTTVVGAGVMSAGTVTAEEPSSESIIRFEELSDEAQRIFRAGLSEGKYTTRETLPNQLVANDYVKYNGTVYDLNQRIHHLHRDRLSPTRASTVPDGASVRSFADLSAADKRAFATALESGEHTFEAGPSHSFDFTDDYLQYQGETYSLGYVHMDIPEYSIAPEQA